MDIVKAAGRQPGACIPVTAGAAGVGVRRKLCIQIKRLDTDQQFRLLQPGHPRRVGEDGGCVLGPGRSTCGSRAHIGISEFVQIKPPGLCRRCNQRSEKNSCPKIPAHEAHDNDPFSAWIKIKNCFDQGFSHFVVVVCQHRFAWYRVCLEPP